MNHHFVQIETPKAGGKYLTDAPSMTLEWSHLQLQVSVKNPETKQTETKTILNEVSGFADPGELLVIMGPSGAGKSTLLDCISGRNKSVEGSVIVNGMPWSQKMKRLTSYVVQDDLFYQTITVREHLVFQARLRMGKTFTEERYLRRVDTVIEELGLAKCRDTMIGGMNVRGISGGERKRLSFATEILTNPSILFVDEPTSGLDSFMAETVVMQLQQLARDGRTVIATIHQPSSELFALFDRLYLLSDGSSVYHGDASASVAYFASIGYQCPSFVNPSDFFMRQLVVIDKTNDVAGVARLETIKDEWRKRFRSMRRPGSAGTDSVFEDMGSRFDDSRLGTFGQIAVLSQRNVVRLLRDKFVLHAGVFQSLFIALVVGLIYMQLDLTQSGIQNFTGAFYFLIVNQTFSAADSAFLSVPLELPIVIREYKAGLYHLIAWYLSKNISELPMQIILPIVFFLPVYFLMGIGHGAGVFLYMQIIMILVNSAAVGLGLMVSCMAKRVDLVSIIGVVVLLPFMLFGGLLINSNDCPDYLVWVQYISPIKYGFEALMKIFWNRIPIIPCDASVENCVATTGAQVLQNYSMQSRSVLGDAAILIVINFGFRIIGFLALFISLRHSK